MATKTEDTIQQLTKDGTLKKGVKSEGTIHFKISSDDASKSEDDNKDTDDSQAADDSDNGDSQAADESDNDDDKNPNINPIPVALESEVGHFHDLGLGRGIDTSDANMWKNKIRIQVRTVNKDLSNIIATDDTGIIERYQKVVSSLKTQQAKIQTSLSDPASNVKIGLDAHYSQSTSSTTIIKGTKVETRTISFRFEFDELPTDEDTAETILEMTDVQIGTFENEIAAWVLASLLDAQTHGTIPPTPDIKTLTGKTAVDKLSRYTAGANISNTSPVAGELLVACRTFVFELGITHYVSTIQLGALRYSTESQLSRTTEKGVGANVGAGSAASASATTDNLDQVYTDTQHEQEIGHFNDKGAVRRDTVDESVIGFHLQPISKLIRIPSVKLAMVTAIEMYLQSKTDDTVGPYLISTTIDNNPVYWKVDQDELIGTEDIKESSFFYIISAGNSFVPSEFTIAYWGDEKSDKKPVTNLSSRLSKLRSTAPKLPAFLTVNLGTFESTSGPLYFKYTFNIKTAKYTIHSRIFNISCACLTRLAGPVSIQTWLEGDEFYIEYSPHALKKVYLAIQKDSTSTHSATYTSTTYPHIKDPDKKRIGMLFRLHPYQLRIMYGRSTPTEAVLQSLLPGGDL